MMLHEAVMLEIYRQALYTSDISNSRCHSAESNNSNGTDATRCPSNESPSNEPSPASPTTANAMKMTLPMSISPAAGVGILPTPTATMAAYLSAAAAAVQRNPLLIGSPLTNASEAALEQCTSPSASLLNQTNIRELSKSTVSFSGVNSDQSVDSYALDFSKKYNQCETIESANGKRSPQTESSDKLAVRSPSNAGIQEEEEEGSQHDPSIPLDLSVDKSRKRPTSVNEIPTSLAKRLCVSTSVLHRNPIVSESSPCHPTTASEIRVSPRSPEKVLTNTVKEHPQGFLESSRRAPNVNKAGDRKHNNWAGGITDVTDIFKCVWCQERFASLVGLAGHMKKAHEAETRFPPGSAGKDSTRSMEPPSEETKNPKSPPPISEAFSETFNKICAEAAAVAAATSSISAKDESGSTLKDSGMPLAPRKLVRGQDVWLGKGAEQTRQILKCMWCGKSFRSLAEMTSHMQETQHYTNIISQEQIISWKSTDGTSFKGPAGNHGPSKPTESGSTRCSVGTGFAELDDIGQSSLVSRETLNAILTCKECKRAFPSLKDLSQHIFQAHKHCAGYLAEAVPTNAAFSKRRPNREKRKKSLPVRKLLEIERAQQDAKGAMLLDSALQPLRDHIAASTKITCEKCGEKTETASFVEHIRQCLGNSQPTSVPAANRRDTHMSPSYSSDDMECQRSTSGSLPKSSSTMPSMLNAIEQLIEKSFDCRLNSIGDHSFVNSQQQQMQLNAAMQMFRSHDTATYDRSASESSYSSERHVSEPSAEENVKKCRLDRMNQRTTESPRIKETFQANLAILPPNCENQSVNSRNPLNLSSNEYFSNANSDQNQDLGFTDVYSRKKNSPVEVRSAGNSLNALSSMFDSLTHMNANIPVSFKQQDIPHRSSDQQSNADPLAALQKLCEKTTSPAKSTPNQMLLRAPSSNGDMEKTDCWPSLSGTPKQTTFKMEIIDDDNESVDSASLRKIQPKELSENTISKQIPKVQTPKPSLTIKCSEFPKQNTNIDNVHLKFLKYTELAKQLSSKEV